MLLTRKTDRKFAFSDLAHADYQEKESSSIIERYFKPLIAMVNKTVRLSDDQQEDLRLKLKQAGMSQSPETFQVMKIVYSLLMAIFFLMMYLFSLNLIILGIGAVATIFMYFYPNRMLKNNIIYANAMRRLELPDYLTPLGLLMYSYTPYQAIKECEKFAGPYLLPFVQDLMVEIDLEPGSTKPFQDFADRLGIQQAQTFVVAIQQAMNTDRTRSRELIQKQVEVMQRLREESYNELINKKPLEVNKYNALMLLNMALIPLSILVYIFNDVFSQI